MSTDNDSSDDETMVEEPLHIDGVLDLRSLDDNSILDKSVVLSREVHSEIRHVHIDASIVPIDSAHRLAIFLQMSPSVETLALEATVPMDKTTQDVIDAIIYGAAMNADSKIWSVICPGMPSRHKLRLLIYATRSTLRTIQFGTKEKVVIKTKNADAKYAKGGNLHCRLENGFQVLPMIEAIFMHHQVVTADILCAVRGDIGLDEASETMAKSKTLQSIDMMLVDTNVTPFLTTMSVSPSVVSIYIEGGALGSRSIRETTQINKTLKELTLDRLVSLDNGEDALRNYCALKKFTLVDTRSLKDRVRFSGARLLHNNLETLEELKISCDTRLQVLSNLPKFVLQAKKLHTLDLSEAILSEKDAKQLNKVLKQPETPVHFQSLQLKLFSQERANSKGVLAAF